MRFPFCVIDKKLTFATPRVLIALLWLHGAWPCLAGTCLAAACLFKSCLPFFLGPILSSEWLLPAGGPARRVREDAGGHRLPHLVVVHQGRAGAAFPASGGARFRADTRAATRNQGPAGSAMDTALSPRGPPERGSLPGEVRRVADRQECQWGHAARCRY